MPHFFQHALREIAVPKSDDGHDDQNGANQQEAARQESGSRPSVFFDLSRVVGPDPAAQERLARLPLSIKLWLEILVRKCDGSAGGSRPQHVDTVLNWVENQGKLEVPFWPARVLMQDFSGVPAIADLAAMRDSVAMRSNSNSSTADGDRLAQELVNPLIPVDLVIDHSIQVLEHGSSRALRVNESAELRQNRERFELMQWASEAFANFRIVPPGSGIVHQVNLELLSRVVFSEPMNFSAGPAAVEADGDSNLPASAAAAAAAAGAAAADQKATAGPVNVLYPDTLVGTDSHTTMVNGIGCLGWGVGGIEAEAAMLGEPLMMLLPSVVGVNITGALPAMCTATDVVLVVVNMLRKENVVGKFVEFFGEGVQQLTAADRATISNMAPEYGATCGLFAVDDVTLQYLEQTGRRDVHGRIGRYYAEAFGPSVHDPRRVQYTKTLGLDLSTVMPAVAGPKRPQDLIPLATLHQDFKACLSNPQPGHKSFVASSKGKKKDALLPPVYDQPLEFTYRSPFPSSVGMPIGDRQERFMLNHGAVVLAAITSCTNTSNPSAMISAGILARNARRHGLAVRPFVKTSLSPGSRVVTEYLSSSGLLRELEELGFFIAGYGCMTCIGNSGPLVPGVSDFIRDNKLVAAAVLSGNRNFEGRVHPDTLANYLASPPLVVALALAGTVNIDFASQPLGVSATDGKTPIFLTDIWPSRKEIQDTVAAHVSRDAFESIYAGGGAEANFWKGNDTWKQLTAANAAAAAANASAQKQQQPSQRSTYERGDAEGEAERQHKKKSAAAAARFAWNSKSTYIQPPPFFAKKSAAAGMSSSNAAAAAAAAPIVSGARCLLYFGHSVTTDHISPAGSIATNSDAGAFLLEQGVPVADFNSYGSRRGNDHVMLRGTFANMRLGNKLVGGGMTGPVTVHFPSGDQMSVFAASQRYRAEGGGVPLVILAGKEYGSGSSRDWAAKGTSLMGVRAVIAESYERIHRSNLVGMGVLPLQFMPGEGAAKFGLTGTEVFTITPSSSSGGGGGNTVTVSTDTGVSFQAQKRVDTAAEQAYVNVGGILPYVVDRLLERVHVGGGGGGAKQAAAVLQGKL